MIAINLFRAPLTQWLFSTLSIALLFIFPQISQATSSTGASAKLDISFVGLDGVHISAYRADTGEGLVSGSRLARTTWKKDKASLTVPAEKIDLKLQKGRATYIIDNVDCSSGSCFSDVKPALMTVNFSGMRSIHTDVYADDGQTGNDLRQLHTRTYWKNDSAKIVVFPQTFDVRIRHRKYSRIIDGVDCSTGQCTVETSPKNIDIKFPGLTSVHTDILLSDGVAGVAGGDFITRSNWKTDQTSVVLQPGIYDLRLRKGKSEIIIDDVDCRSGDCSSGITPALMTVNFPGMRSIHTDVLVDDGQVGNDLSLRHTRMNWKNNRAEILVFPQKFDVQIRHGKLARVIDAVDCSSGQCTVDASPSNLNVKFTGLSSVHTDVMLADGQAGVASGSRITRSYWKSDETNIAVQPGIYDLRLRKGKSELILDNVDCRSGDCTSGITPAVMTVNFPGLHSIHTDVFVDDGAKGNDLKQRHARSYWKSQRAEILVFPQTFDVRIRQSRDTRIIDAVDCSSGSCTVDASPNQLNVKFAGLSGVHTDVMLSDGVAGTAAGSRITRANWKTDEATIAVQPGIYDLRIRKGKSVLILDDVDCSSGDCTADVKPARLTVLFEGMSSVHTDVIATDGVSGSVSDDRFTRANWKKEKAEIIVFPQVFDLKVRHGSGTLILDDIDCQSGTCIADTKPANLIVNFPGLSSIHTAVHLSDGVASSADGGYFTRSNWKKESAEIKVFPLLYDLEVRQGAKKLVVDDVDCRTGACVVNDLVATLSVDFPGLYGVHTSVNIDDGLAGEVTGKRVTRANWRSDAAEVAVLRGTYDVAVNHSRLSVFDQVDCGSATCQIEVTGNAQITLKDGDTGKPIPEARLYAYEKLADGQLISRQRGRTSPEGKVHFTLDGLGEGHVYVIKAYNPYGKYKKYYSQLLTQTGGHLFTITRDGDYPLDVTPPTVVIDSPADSGTVSFNGFIVSGSATDNNAVQSLLVNILDPLKGLYQTTATVAANGQWQVAIPAANVSANQTVSIVAKATDRALNSAEASVSARVIEDQSGPQIIISSHSGNDVVPATGFLLSGNANDETGVASMSVIVTDSQLGITLQRNVDVSDSGAWTLAIASSDLADGSDLDIQITAVDVEGNSSSLGILLRVVASSRLDLHMINRTTFGATPELLTEVANMGALLFLDQQLNPDAIDDSMFDQLIAGYSPSTTAELQQYALLHMINSRKQLREVMTQFWDNHFNTAIGTKRMDADGVEHEVTTAYELQENQLFRANALGNFRDLLGISAKSPAMLIYLDSISNVAADSNENYPRELMELHTLKVDGGYTGADVAAAAELLTGWTIRDGQFFFDAARHNPDAQTVMGVTIPAGGEEQGDRLLDVLAAHPSTAKFICEKLVTLLVSDEQVDSLVSRCSATYLINISTDDQITQMLRAILTSPEFGAEYRTKIKTPVEFVVGALRNLEATTDASDLSRYVGDMGMRLFQNPVPTGYSEVGSDWINASLLIERMKWVNRLSREVARDGRSSVDPLNFFAARGFETSEGIANFLIDITLTDDHSVDEVDQALQVLNQGAVFDINAPDAETKLRALEGVVLSFPEYQFQ